MSGKPVLETEKGRGVFDTDNHERRQLLACIAVCPDCGDEVHCYLMAEKTQTH